MLQISILAGKSKGQTRVFRQFPCLIGRSAENHLRLDDSGIWDRHITIRLKKGDGFFMETGSNALATLNGHPETQARICNGDILGIGGTALQCWLSPAPLRGLRLREGIVWLFIGLVLMAQVILIYLLCR